MMLSAAPLERRLQTAAIILLLGLLVEVLCLLGKGPMAFTMFAGFCVLLFVAGILLYLHFAGRYGLTPTKPIGLNP
jgi:hypothetical protein